MVAAHARVQVTPMLEAVEIAAGVVALLVLLAYLFAGD
jgi:hypothetical protein